MKFSKHFKGVPNGGIYPVEYEPGQTCPPELEAGALALDAVHKPKTTPPPPPAAKKPEPKPTDLPLAAQVEAKPEDAPADPAASVNPSVPVEGTSPADQTPAV